MKAIILHDAPRQDVLSGEHQNALASVTFLRDVGVDARLADWSDVSSRRSRGGAGWDSYDVAVINKWFPRASFRGQLPLPSVYRVHNFLPLCLAGTFSRDGKQCLDCLTRSTARGVIHRCYRGRIPLSAVSAGVNEFQKKRGLLRHANRIVFASSLARELFTAALPHITMRTSVIPHGVAPPPVGSGTRCRRQAGRFVFLGQLSRFKGIRELLREWPTDLELRIGGDGELANEVQAVSAARHNVKYLGRLTRSQVFEELEMAQALVFPGHSPEAFGLVHAEACAVGTPTIALAGSSVASEVLRLKTGVVVPSMALLAATARCAPLPTEAHVRRAYDNDYSPRVWATRFRSELERAVLSRRFGDQR